MVLKTKRVEVSWGTSNFDKGEGADKRLRNSRKTGGKYEESGIMEALRTKCFQEGVITNVRKC